MAPTKRVALASDGLPGHHGAVEVGPPDVPDTMIDPVNLAAGNVQSDLARPRQPRDQDHFVGAVESDPSAGRISVDSPVGRALVGHKKGDKVTVSVPLGTLTLTIKAVK